MTTNLILATRPATSIFRSHVAWTGWGMGMECHHPPPHPPPQQAPGVYRGACGGRAPALLRRARAFERLSLKLTSTLQTCLTS